jgi:hypothetical protein
MTQRKPSAPAMSLDEWSSVTNPHDRVLGQSARKRPDLNQLRVWFASQPEVPEGDRSMFEGEEFKLVAPLSVTRLAPAC